MEWINKLGPAVVWVRDRWLQLTAVTGGGAGVSYATSASSWWPYWGIWFQIVSLVLAGITVAIKLLYTYWEYQDRRARRKRG